MEIQKKRKNEKKKKNAHKRQKLSVKVTLGVESAVQKGKQVENITWDMSKTHTHTQKHETP